MTVKSYKTTVVEQAHEFGEDLGKQLVTDEEFTLDDAESAIDEEKPPREESTWNKWCWSTIADVISQVASIEGRETAVENHGVEELIFTDAHAWTDSELPGEIKTEQASRRRVVFGDDAGDEFIIKHWNDGFPSGYKFSPSEFSTKDLTE